MAICSTSTRVESVSANTPPPAFTTKVLPLYMRMYGAALFSAAMARVWSERFIIFSFPRSQVRSSGSEQLVEHRHLHDEAVVRFTLHDAAWTIEHFIRHRGVAADRQAMHE